MGNTRNPAWGKLGHNWEGPYRVTLVAKIKAYCLEDLSKIPIPRLLKDVILMRNNNVVHIVSFFLKVLLIPTS